MKRSRLLEVLVICIGAIAQLGERVLCKHEVVGSIPSGSTISGLWFGMGKRWKRSELSAKDPLSRHSI